MQPRKRRKEICHVIKPQDDYSRKETVSLSSRLHILWRSPWQRSERSRLQLHPSTNRHQICSEGKFWDLTTVSEDWVWMKASASLSAFSNVAGRVQGNRPSVSGGQAMFAYSSNKGSLWVPSWIGFLFTGRVGVVSVLVFRHFFLESSHHWQFVWFIAWRVGRFMTKWPQGKSWGPILREVFMVSHHLWVIDIPSLNSPVSVFLEVARILYQICIAVKHLHSMGIAHRGKGLIHEYNRMLVWFSIGFFVFN